MHNSSKLSSFLRLLRLGARLVDRGGDLTNRRPLALLVRAAESLSIRPQALTTTEHRQESDFLFPHVLSPKFVLLSILVRVHDSEPAGDELCMNE